MDLSSAYPIQQRDELIGGKMVAMAPRPSFNHTYVTENISFLFRGYLKGKSCVPLGDGYDLYLTVTDRFVPDFMVICDRSKIKHDGVHGAPDLVVEVLSPRTMKHDRGHKKDTYARCGVREYWIVNTNDQSIEQYLLRDGHLELEEIYTLHPDRLEIMTEEEKAEVITEFKCRLFDDLIIPLEDVFSGLLE